MDPALVAACLIGAYVLGSVPFGWLLGLSRGIDIRKFGSGNIGATNLGRALGRRWAIAAFLLDFSKGLLPVVAARLVPTASSAGGTYLAMACGAIAIGGHVFPVFLRFRGGKGVATALGAMAGLAWPAALASGIAWVLVFFASRFVSVASIAAALVLPLAMWWSQRNRPTPEWAALEGCAVIVAALIIVRHRSNISRLLRGEEHRFTPRSRAPEAAAPETGPRGATDSSEGS